MKTPRATRTRLALVPVAGEDYDGPSRYAVGPVGDWLVRLCRYEPFELAGVISVSRDLRILSVTVVHRGTENRTDSDPRAMLAPPLILGAARVATFHNHPSGNTAPSAPDLRVTDRTLKACTLLGLDFLDDYVVSPHAWGVVPIGPRPRREDGEFLPMNAFFDRCDGRSRVAAKYRHPKTGATWSGRGTMARWLRQELDAGCELREFQVEPDKL